jgi:nucleotide-binding universal stress UspA family protein
MLPLSEGDNKAQVMKPIRNILVTLDGSILGDSILPVAVDLARSLNAKLTLLTVVHPVPMLIPESVGTFASSAEVPDESATRYVVGEATKQLEEHEKALRKDGFTNVETKVVVAPNIARMILEFAAEKKVDAVALSTHGRGASRLLLGSIADKIIRAAKLPVLVHRPASVEKMNELINTSKLELELPALTVY